jgi:hypothetical protein
MRKALAGLAILGATIPATQPAFAIAVGTTGVSGGITVSSDFTVCAELTFASGGLVVGEFSAVGEMQGPGTKVGTVRSAEPILSTNGHWSSCISGAYLGATVGDAKITLVASSATSDYVEVKQCVINFGALTCF